MLSCPAPWLSLSVLAEVAPVVVSTTEVPSQVRFVPAIVVTVKERWLISGSSLGQWAFYPVGILSN